MATVGQQIKVAQAQKGLSVPAIAAHPGRPAKFGAKTLGRVIRGERDLEPHEAEWLSGVLDVPTSFFYEDPTPAGQDDLADRLAAIEQALADASRERDEHAAEIRKLLKRQDGILSSIEDRIAVEKTVKAEADEARKRLLEAAAVASRAYEDAAQRLAATLGRQAT